MTPPKFVFWGSDDFSIGVLDGLAAKGHQPTLIVGTPPSLKRGQPQPAATAHWAASHQIPFTVDPTTIAPQAYDFFIVASYGQIISPELLRRPKLGTINVHPSLLPKYRGATPLQSAILNNDSETGVTLIELDEQLDHGPILAQTTEPLDHLNFSELRDRLARRGAELLDEILPAYLAKTLKPQEQNHDQATFTRKFTKVDAELKATDSALTKFKKVLALNPEPGTWLIDERGRRLKIKTARLEDGQFIPEKVVPEGKREMAWSDYCRGQQS